jgi:hypothetical protein
MNNMKKSMLLAAAALLAACSTPATYERLRQTNLTNDQGHVVGHVEVLRDLKTGQEVEHEVNYSPRYDEGGEVIGYEEPLPEGTQLRGLDGRRVGVRYRDVRARGMNPSGEGVSVTVPPTKK